MLLLSIGFVIVTLAYAIQTLLGTKPKALYPLLRVRDRSGAVRCLTVAKQFA